MRSVFPFGGVVNLRFRSTCHQVARVLSCGSSERWRSPGIVGPYWLGPPSVPFARMVCQARSASRFSDTRVERGVASNNAFYLPFFDATAEYHRSDESSGSCARPEAVRCVRGAEHRIGTGERLRIRLSRLHPRVGLDNSGDAMQASLQGEARGTGLFNAFCSQDGSVLGLGPFVFLALRRLDGRAASVELRHFAGKPAG